MGEGGAELEAFMIIVIVVGHLKRRRQGGKLTQMHVRRQVHESLACGKPVHKLWITWGQQLQLDIGGIPGIGVPPEKRSEVIW